MTKTFNASLTTLYTFSVKEEDVREAYDIPEDKDIPDFLWNDYAFSLLTDFELVDSSGQIHIIPNDIEFEEDK